MKLIVGLGNPGRKYANTRHNVGFEVVGELARKCGASRPREKFHGELAEADLDGQRVLLLRPLAYMNRSGGSVLSVRDYYRINNQDLLVVCDDFHLPMAKLRFRAKGSSGGQKGLEDIIRHLGTDEFSRLRIGIGPLPERWDAADFVLSRFAERDRPIVQEAIARAAEGAAAWSREGVEYCMNHYNAS